jgi:uncharacterized protein (TIGR02996 family)
VNPTEQSLLETIRAEPWDDGPRLVYADWLDEHGEGDRAELIRVQIARRTGGPDDPLASREKEILTRRSAGWVGPLAGARVHFRRGMAVASWTTLPEFEEGTARLAEAGDPAWVVERRLHLNGCRFDPADFEAFVHAPGYGRLTRFHPAGWRGTSGDVVFLLGLTAEMARTAAGSPLSANLLSLGMRNADLGAAGARAVADSPHLGRLRQLDLASCNLTQGGVAALADSRRLENLTALSLAGVGLGDEGIGALAGARGLSRLESLNLANNRIGDARLRRLLRAPWAGRLKRLLLTGNLVRDGGARAIAGCAELSGLEVLDLGANQFGDDGVRALLDSPHLSGLRALALGFDRRWSGPVREEVRRRFGGPGEMWWVYYDPDWGE